MGQGWEVSVLFSYYKPSGSSTQCGCMSVVQGPEQEEVHLKMYCMACMKDGMTLHRLLNADELASCQELSRRTPLLVFCKNFQEVSGGVCQATQAA